MISFLAHLSSMAHPLSLSLSLCHSFSPPSPYHLNVVVFICFSLALLLLLPLSPLTNALPPSTTSATAYIPAPSSSSCVPSPTPSSAALPSFMFYLSYCCYPYCTPSSRYCSFLLLMVLFPPLLFLLLFLLLPFILSNSFSFSLHPCSCSCSFYSFLFPSFSFCSFLSPFLSLTIQTLYFFNATYRFENFQYHVTLIMY